MFRQTHVVKQRRVLRLFEHRGYDIVTLCYIEILAIITGEQLAVRPSKFGFSNLQTNPSLVKQWI